PCAKPPPPWYRRPSTNRPTILRFTLSCSNVSFIPAALSPPQPKQGFVGFGSSLMMSLKFSSRLFRAYLLAFDLIPVPRGCVPLSARRAAACASPPSAFPQE